MRYGNSAMRDVTKPFSLWNGDIMGRGPRTHRQRRDFDDAMDNVGYSADGRKWNDDFRERRYLIYNK